MAKIAYTNKDKTAASGSAARQWRDVDANEVKTSVNDLYDAVDTKADLLGDTTVHTGTDWDGTPKYRELTGNLALTLTTTLKSGLFVFKQDATGSRTLSIDGTAIPITATANAVSIVQFFLDAAASQYRFIVDAVVSAVAPDTTAPTLLTATVENANPSLIILTYDEALDAGSVPATSAYTVEVDLAVNLVTNVNVTGSTVELTLTTPVTAGDSIELDYLAGASPIQDAAGNDAANLNNQNVTNNVAAMDSDAQAIITAIEATDAGALSTTQKNAINARVVALKAQSKWTNMVAYYGCVGGTAASHAINWKTPGTFNVTWNGGLTHAATGVLGNGSTGYGNTGINDNTVLTLDEVTIGAYVRTTNDTVNGFAMGCMDTTGLYIADGATMACRLHRGADLSSATTPTRLLVASRQTVAPLEAIYRDGTQLNTSSNATTGKINGNIFLMALNNVGTGSTVGYSSEEYGSWFIYNGGFTAAEVTQFTTDETAFQTSLTRNV